MALVPLQHASFSPTHRRSLLPSGLGACRDAVRRLDTRYCALASVEAHARAATTGVQAIGGTWRVSMPSATMSDGSPAAAARVVLATTASQPAAKRPQSLPWCSLEARHSTERLSERAGSGWQCTGSSRARIERQLSSRQPSCAMALKPWLAVWQCDSERAVSYECCQLR